MLNKQLWLALATAGFVGGCVMPACSASLGADAARLRLRVTAAVSEPVLAVQPTGVSGRATRRARTEPGAKAPRAAAAPALPVARRARQFSPSLARVRMRMGRAEPLVVAGGAVEQAMQAVAEAAAAARKSASAASAAADRIAALERTIEQMRAEALSARTEADQLRDQRAHGASSTSSWMIGAAATVLALLAGWLALRLSAARQAQDMAWKKATPEARQALIAADLAERQPTAVMAFVHSDLDTAPLGAQRTRPAPAWPPPAPSDGWEPPMPSDTEPLRSQPPSTAASPNPPRSVAKVQPAAAKVPPTGPATPAWAGLGTSVQGAASSPVHLDEEGMPARDVSIDELLDLEQQAEFFVVLGQDDAAIELLIEHLRHTGGSSPLPYLKLLEIHRRRGDHSDYERMRARFNHRFNAYAPEWEVDLQSGRSFSDYAGVLTRLQQLWARPLDSMAELESLMFRKSTGELFDLPAYREVLFLYALARDLHDRGAADGGSVDLLLPLSDGCEFSKTSPAPFRALGHDAPHGAGDLEERTTGPVDLDLSLDSSRPSSIFDPLEETPTHPRIR